MRVFISVLGHGSTEIGEVLRIYQEAGLVRVAGVRSEIEASHAAAALRWVTGEKAAVVTSIGPGALQAMAASISPASNGLGVWYLLGDETTEDEGPNMQQIPRPEQGLFLKLFAQMGQAYSLHTPLALPTALRRGLNTVDHPHRGGPFYLLLPMNVQAQALERFNLDELPTGAPPPLGAAADLGAYERAAQAILQARRVIVRLGGGSRQAAAPSCWNSWSWRMAWRSAPHGAGCAPLPAPPQHDGGRFQRLAVRKLCYGKRRPIGRHRIAWRMPVRLFAHWLPAGAAGDQYQH